MASLTPSELQASTPVLSALIDGNVIKLRRLADGPYVTTSTKVGSHKAKIVGGPYVGRDPLPAAISHFHHLVRSATPKRTYAYDTTSTSDQEPSHH